MSKAGKRLLEAAREAVSIARGEAKPARVHVPVSVEVKAVRGKLGMSQDEFAASFGFTLNQIRDWEQGRSRPTGGLRAYLTIIERDPDSVRRLLSESRSRAA